MRRRILVSLFLSLCAVVSAEGKLDYSKRKEATKFTIEKNNEIERQLDFSNKKDFEEARKGFIATWPDNKILDENGNVVWNFESFDFLGVEDNKKSPDTVNPSLWRNAQLNQINGLFKVTDGIYQVRGFDLGNITFVRGDKGWIVIDMCTTVEVAKAGYELLKTHVADLPITGVIATHSHLDHFGGIKGVVSKEDVASGKVPFIAPDTFFEESVSENLIAGNAMGRRASYMYGSILPRDEKGTVDAGLGKAVSVGTNTILEPSKVVEKTGEKLTIDGIEFDFLMANGTEAPSEFMFYIPKYKAFCGAEVINRTLHNISTLRGAQTRDALKWSKSIDQAVQLYGDKSEVIFAPHYWPKWGQEDIKDMLEKHRDTYKFIHDQTLRLANQGQTPIEISEMVKLPDALNKEFFNRGYYGTVSHNTKAVYDKYFGAWWDGNPSNLYKLPPVEAAKNYVEFMGGETEVIEKAKGSYDKGEYRWVVEILNQVIFANPKNKEARELSADAMEQLGYQAESGPWRAYFLTGAQELRNGVVALPTPNPLSKDMINGLPTLNFLDYLAVRVNPEKANGLDLKINIKFTDLNEDYSVVLKNSVLNSYDKLQKNPNSEIILTRDTFNKMLLKETTFEKEIKNNNIKVTNPENVNKLVGTLDNFKFWFNIVEPNVQ
ncbi:MBL fold metallo-hydrolase [Cetobacterium sp. 2A]|uniref:alkyl/aryl-sulfatase n=2 Tax=unclassified Cetobacterium TaxID=2630983 RepID=UPI00163C4E23|nr:alkyl sulfatase dimerization domain-containing protein [Cetobacterium sp. 2A]MBC2855186.1 MBL fold metallo-hydrolase [Cetobacterium sp. 2A]